MATYYWVGGSGTWSDVSTGNWALTSGGTPTTLYPTSVDDVIFDDNSSATSYTVNIAVGYLRGGVAKDIIFNGPASGNLTVTSNASGNCFGSFFVAPTGVILSNANGWFMSATTSGNAITTSGLTIPCAFTFNGAGGVWNLTGALTTTQAISLTNGTLNTNGFNVSCLGFSVTGTLARTLNLGASIVTCTTTTTAWVATTVTNLTFNAGTSTIICSNASPSFISGGLTYYDITFSSTALVLASLTGAFTCRNLTFATRAASGRGGVSLAANIVVTGLLDITSGTIGSARTLIQSSAWGTARTITAASESLTDVDFADITAAGAGAPFTGTRLGNFQGNTNITFDAPKTVYWSLAAGGVWSSNAWATTSGGAPATANFPLAQDAVIINNINLNTSATITMNASYGVGSIDCSARTAAFTFAIGTISPWIFGDLKLSTTVTPSGTGAWLFGNRTANATITSAGRAMWAFTTYCIGQSVLLADAFTTTVTVTLLYGTLNTQNFNLTALSLTGTGTTTRALTLGTSTVTLTGTTTAWSFATVTGLTYSGASATIVLNSGSPTFAGGGLTYNIVNFTNTAFLNLSITGANTFGTLSFANRAADGNGQLTITGNQTITTLNLPNSTSIKSRLRFYSTTAGVPVILTVGAVTGLTNMDFRDITIAGASSPWSGTGLGNELGNTNISFNAGTTYYWNLAAGGNWNANAWATTSGGTPAVGNFPLAQDTAIIENAGLNTGATITLGSNYSIGTLNMSGRTNAMTWAHGGFGLYLFQDLLTTSAITFTTAGGAIIFYGQGRTQLITSNGANFPQYLQVACVGGTVKLVDNLICTAALNGFLVQFGTFDLNNQTLTSTYFFSSYANTRTLAFGTSGVINITGNNTTVWTTNLVTNMTITGTSRNVNFTYAGATGTRTISNGHLEANPLDFNITAGTDIVSVTNARNLNFTGFSGTIANATRTIFGNLTIPNTVVTPVAGALVTTFGATSGTQTITTNGKLLDFPITLGQAVASTTIYFLADSLFVGGGKTVGLNAGTLNLNGNTLACGFFVSNNTQVRTINFADGTIEVLYFGNSWNITTSTNLTIAGAGVISMNSAEAKTFIGGGKFYPTLNQGGIGQLSITGANTFSNITNTAQPATITFPTASITTVFNMVLTGLADNLITINSSTAGVQATLYNPEPTTISVNYCSIIDSNVTGGARWSAYFINGNIDAGNNTGWIWIAPLQSNNLIFAEFVRVTTPSATYRFASTPSALTIPAVDSEPFSALGQLIKVNEAQQDIKSTANETTFTLVGIDTTMLGWVLGQEIKGSKIEAWHGFFDETGALITDIGTGGLTKFFTGYINSFTISEQWMEEIRVFVGVITVSASSIQLILKNRVAGRYTNDNSWQFFNSGDTSMNRVSFVTNINYYFGKGASPNS